MHQLKRISYANIIKVISKQCQNIDSIQKNQMPKSHNYYIIHLR